MDEWSEVWLLNSFAKSIDSMIYRWKMESTVNLDTENCKIESDSPGEYFINDDNVD